MRHQIIKSCKITIHCVVGQCSVEALGKLFASSSTSASSNYGIGYDGRIIDANLEVLTAGLTFMYKEGTFEFGIGAVWFGYSVTIDIDEIIKIIFGG